MRLNDYKELMDYNLQHKTLKVSSNKTIMELFNYFVIRDMILGATFMQSSSNEQEEEQTLLQIKEEKQIEMETDVLPLDCLDFDTFSKAELFYFNHKEKEPKAYVRSLLYLKKTVSMSKKDNLVFQKSKHFFALEKRNGNSPECFGLCYTKENRKLNWIHRRLEI